MNFFNLKRPPCSPNMRLVSKSNLRIWGIPLLRPSFSFFETNRLRDEVERRGGGRREEGLYCSFPPSPFSIPYFCLTTTFVFFPGGNGVWRRRTEIVRGNKSSHFAPPCSFFPFFRKQKCTGEAATARKGHYERGGNGCCFPFSSTPSSSPR